MMDMKKDTMMGMTIVIGSMEDIIQIQDMVGTVHTDIMLVTTGIMITTQDIPRSSLSDMVGMVTFQDLVMAMGTITILFIMVGAIVIITEAITAILTIITTITVEEIAETILMEPEAVA